MNDILKVGVAQVAITPPIGTGLAGYFHQRESTAVKDELYAKALVVSTDEQSIALVACDLIARYCYSRFFNSPIL